MNIDASTYEEIVDDTKETISLANCFVRQKTAVIIGKGSYKKVYKGTDMEKRNEIAWNEVSYDAKVS